MMKKFGPLHLALIVALGFAIIAGSASLTYHRNKDIVTRVANTLDNQTDKETGEYLQSSKVDDKDVWGNDLTIVYTNRAPLIQQVSVISPGRDRTIHTSDDVRIIRENVLVRKTIQATGKHLGKGAVDGVIESVADKFKKKAKE